MSREERLQALSLRDSVQPELRMRLEARLLLLPLPQPDLALSDNLLNLLLPLPTHLVRLAVVALSANLSHNNSSSNNLSKTLSVVRHSAPSHQRSVKLQERLEQRHLLQPHQPLALLAPLVRLLLLLARSAHLERRNLRLLLDLERLGSLRLLQLNLRRPVLARLDSLHNSSLLLPPMLSVNLRQVDLARLELVSHAIYILIVQLLI